MDKLELKHLAPYLPYGLKVHYEHTNEIDTVHNLYSIEDYNDIKIGIGWESGQHIWMFKLILRPLTDIDKKIEGFNGTMLGSSFYNSEQECYLAIVNEEILLKDGESSDLYNWANNRFHRRQGCYAKLKQIEQQIASNESALQINQSFI